MVNLNNFKNILFDLGGVLLNIDFEKTTCPAKLFTVIFRIEFFEIDSIFTIPSVGFG